VVIKSNLTVFGNEESMKDYIIDLGLEFGLRIGLVMSYMKQLGTNKNNRGRAF